MQEVPEDRTYIRLQGIDIEGSELMDFALPEQEIIESLQHNDVILRKPVDFYPFNALEFLQDTCYWHDIQVTCDVIK